MSLPLPFQIGLGLVVCGYFFGIHSITFSGVLIVCGYGVYVFIDKFVGSSLNNRYIPDNKEIKEEVEEMSEYKDFIRIDGVKLQVELDEYNKKVTLYDDDYEKMGVGDTLEEAIDDYKETIHESKWKERQLNEIRKYKCNPNTQIKKENKETGNTFGNDKWTE